MPTTYPVHNPPDTVVKSSHGIQIKVRGTTIGVISNFTPGPETRQMTHVYELNPLSSGHPVDLVPGNLAGFTINVARYDIWNEPFEKIFGGGIEIYEALGNQYKPFEVYRYWYHPDGYKEILVYRNCYMSSVGRNFQSTGDRIVMVNGTMAFLRKDKIA